MLSLREIAGRYAISIDSLFRHKSRHMTREQQAAIVLGRAPAEIDLEKLQRVESTKMLAEIVDQRVRLRQIRDLAVQHGGFALAVACENSIRSTLELECKLLGPILSPLFDAKNIDPDVVRRIEHVIIRPDGSRYERDDPPSTRDPLSTNTAEPEPPSAPANVEPSPTKPLEQSPEPPRPYYGPPLTEFGPTRDNVLFHMRDAFKTRR